MAMIEDDGGGGEKGTGLSLNSRDHRAAILLCSTVAKPITFPMALPQLC